MSLDFVKKVIIPEVKKICEQKGDDYSIATLRGYAFQQWVADLMSRHDQSIDQDEVYHLRARDGGIDIVLYAPNQRHCYVVQTKHIGAKSSVKREDILGFFALQDKIIRDDYEGLKNVSGDAQEVILEYVDKISQGWNATWVFATTGKIPANYVSQDDTGMVVYDSSELSRKYNDSIKQESSIPDEVIFDLPKDSFMQLERPRKTLIAVVEGNALCNIYSQHKDSILAYNIRKYMGERKINEGIVATAQKSPNDFFYCNNGISAICNEFRVVGNKVYAKKLQVINGGQTVGSLYKAGKKRGGNHQLSGVRVLLRLTEGEGTATEKGFNADVIRYNNTQNPIKDSDFRANDIVQLDLIKKFKAVKNNTFFGEINYRPKRGAKSGSGKSLTLEQLAKVKYAYENSPCVSTESPKTLWDLEENYNDVFLSPDECWGEDDFNNCALALAFYYAVVERTNILKKNAKDKGSDSAKFNYLYKLRYFILGLSRVFVEEREISVTAWKNKAKFHETFMEFWKTQMPLISPLKSEGHDAKNAKGLYNIARNETRWKRLREDYEATLQGMA